MTYPPQGQAPLARTHVHRCRLPLKRSRMRIFADLDPPQTFALRADATLGNERQMVGRSGRARCKRSQRLQTRSRVRTTLQGCATLPPTWTDPRLAPSKGTLSRSLARRLFHEAFIRIVRNPAPVLLIAFKEPLLGGRAGHTFDDPLLAFAVHPVAIVSVAFEQALLRLGLRSIVERVGEPTHFVSPAYRHRSHEGPPTGARRIDNSKLGASEGAGPDSRHVAPEPVGGSRRGGIPGLGHPASAFRWANPATQARTSPPGPHESNRR